ncbi:putative histidinol-phosphatase [Wickerhamomyces ciferrii]|uniref:Histidinol-phosphatase n=1 Tax=Wickerhamomyces ciferrii (strain ATCC 14091 / BCRC 22168 / CBS 111 / JCM 3599 / NBRC 0793 / NRRL Y-1031 F-60-10) TaxID=1206466 RepID=K0KMB4_WICCF|nr:putative histidinol-phosphatase [Wickerhamomyces ciferrii]CCH42519.1 putative histidinol-phosphatase [Wickerhamomyces ciferrii]
MHSHHSHSGDYVAHAQDTLESITQRAIDMGFETFCLTEHMPRLDNKFLYPEEEEQNFSISTLEDKFLNFHKHAIELQQDKIQQGSKTKFLVGLEVEGINEAHIDYTVEILSKHHFDMTVGSVHFVKEFPIDYGRPKWESARDASGGLRGLFKEYYALQSKVLTKLKPLIVGHFDLIRLFSHEDDLDETTGKFLKDIVIENDWPEVWEQIVENLKFIKSYGGILELNSAAIRKGWSTPYPRTDITNAAVKYGGGRFALSDDSHSIAQVGLNFHKVKDYIVNDIKVDSIFYLDLEDGKTVIKEKSIKEFTESSFWEQYK